MQCFFRSSRFPYAMSLNFEEEFICPGYPLDPSLKNDSEMEIIHEGISLSIPADVWYSTGDIISVPDGQWTNNQQLKSFDFEPPLSSIGYRSACIEYLPLGADEEDCAT